MLTNMNICRTCLTEDVDKDVNQLTEKIDGETRSYSEIMLFCLSIEVESHSKITSRLCMKCYLKIISFYEFKVLALKNDEHLRSTTPKDETKDGVLSDLNDHDGVGSEEIVYLEDVKVEVKKEEISSDDEALSVIKSTKHEKDNKTVKENDIVKPFKRKDKRKSIGEFKKKDITCCTECGKTVINMRDHMNTHKPKSLRKRYHCKEPGCDKMFAGFSARLRHYKSIHLGIKKKCPHCSIEVTPNTYTNHLITFHKNKDQGPEMQGVQDKPYLCDYCSKSFSKKYCLQMHIRSHTKEKPLACPECGACFSMLKTLSNHMTVHSDVKPFACEICDKKFSRQAYLKSHMVSHTKEKLYPCKYCGTRFGRSDHRRRHERSHERHVPVIDIFNEVKRTEKKTLQSSKHTLA